jgi:hypothetical protein
MTAEPVLAPAETPAGDIRADPVTSLDSAADTEPAAHAEPAATADELAGPVSEDRD